MLTALFHELLALQEAGWTQYPTFEELHQILYRAELNIYEAFNLPPGITAGDGGSHVNEKTMEMVKKLLDRPPRFVVEVRMVSFFLVGIEYEPLV